MYTQYSLSYKVTPSTKVWWPYKTGGLMQATPSAMIQWPYKTVTRWPYTKGYILSPDRVGGYSSGWSDKAGSIRCK